MQEEDFLLDEASVLAFLADCELVTDAPPSPALSTPTQMDTLRPTWSDSASSISSSGSLERPAEAKKKTWRQHRKEEVLHLREIAKLLSVELERLKFMARVHSTAHSQRNTEASSTWQRIAERQSSLRLRSEEKNVKLREAVTQQLHQAKSLRRAIKRKLRENLVFSSAMDLFRNNRLNTGGMMPPQDNKAVFDMLMTGLDDVYENIDGYLEAVGMQKLSCPGRKNNTMESRRSRGMFVEFLDNYPLPFNVQETADAIWTPIDPWAKDHVHFFEKSTIGGNTKLGSMSISFSLDGVDFCILQRDVKRKYVERGRVVIVRRTMIQPYFKGMSISFIETTRMILKRGDLSVLGPTTEMQTQREAKIYGDLPIVNAEKYPSIDVGMKDWENSITRHNNRVEDQLVAMNKA